MKVLFFDLRDSEKPYFDTNEFCDLNIEFFEESLGENTKLSEEQYREADILCVYRSSMLTEKVLKKFPNLRIVSTRSYNFNHIDLRYCKEKNIAVLNVGQYGEKAVAQYGLGLIIALIRRIKEAVTDIQNHRVNPKLYEGKLLNNITLGIVGCGKVGIELAKIAKNFDMKVLVSSYKEKPSFDGVCNVVQFDELLSMSDVIFLHMPYTIENYQIIGKDEIAKMKFGVIIVNTSCVDLLDIEALYNALESGKVRAAGLDILDSDFVKGKSKELGNETMSTKNNTKITSKLLEMPNVIITPHIAYNTVDSINTVLDITMNNIRDFCKGFNTNRII